MLKKQDKIFNNIYGFEKPNLINAIKRGDWCNTKTLINLGHDNIIDKIKKSGLRPIAFKR